MAADQNLGCLLSLLIALAVIEGTHAVDYLVTTNSAGCDLVRYNEEVGVDYSKSTLMAATDFVLTTFQQNSPADRKPVQKISLVIEQYDGVAYTINDEIHFSCKYIGSYSGNLKSEFTGVIYHEMTHVWQWNGNGQAPGGLIEGIADFVRLKAGYAPSHWVQPGQGDKWDQGYDVTARFLDYCESLRTGFVAELNKKMKTGYNDGYFVDLLGKTVQQLWTDYKAKYGR